MLQSPISVQQCSDTKSTPPSLFLFFPFPLPQKLQNYLPSCPPTVRPFKGLLIIFEPPHTVHKGPAFPLVHQLRDLLQLLPIRGHDEKEIFHILIRTASRPHLFRRLKHTDENSPVTDSPPRIFKGFTAYAIDDDVDKVLGFLSPFAEVGDVVVEDLLRAEGLYELEILRTTSADYLCAC